MLVLSMNREQGQQVLFRILYLNFFPVYKHKHQLHFWVDDVLYTNLIIFIKKLRVWIWKPLATHVKLYWIQWIFQKYSRSHTYTQHMKYYFCHITFIESTENIDFCVFLLFSQIIIFWKAFFLSALATLILLSMLWIQFSNPSKPDIWVYHTKRCDFAQFCQMTISNAVNIWQCLVDLEKDIQNVMIKSEALDFNIRVFQKMEKR